MAKINDYSLYLVLSEEYAMGRSALEVAELAISSGIDILQMREKTRPERELIELGKKLLGRCKAKGVSFIVNDDPFLAKRIGADGVHLGQEDIKRWSIAEARDIMNAGKIIGLSTHSLGQFEDANSSDVDYIAFGPVFPTKTKDYFIGTADIKNVLETARKPVFFIGGITLSNIDEILFMGAKNIALIRDITEAEDIVSRTRGFKEKIAKRKEGVEA